jgi:hypothetical protein
VTAKNIRNGKGHRANRRNAERLKKKTAMEGLVCTWCGRPIDTTLPSTDRLSFTSDHDDAINAGGSLVTKALNPMHRACNAAKGDSVKLDLGEWGAS